jgi:hypothetical protein
VNRKLPKNAFDFYVELGVERSYQAVADRFGVTKVAVVNCAQRENWQERLRTLEAEAREKSDKKAVETLEAVRERQLKAARFLMAKALEAMAKLPPEQAIRAAPALSIAWKHELLLLGEPTDRQANVEEITKRELARWLVVEDGKETTDHGDDVAQGQ